MRHIFLLPILIPLGAGIAHAQDEWGPDEIRQTLRTWLSEHGKGVDAGANIGPLDDRMHVAACPAVEIAPRSARSTSYVIKCNAPEAWQYVVRVDQDKQTPRMMMAKADGKMPNSMPTDGWRVVVPRVNLTAGTILTADYLEERPSDVYPGASAIKFIAEAFGLRLTTSVGPGNVLTTQNVAKAPLVMKGEPVTILASGSGFNISMPGKAEEDGFEGTLISVRNTQSGVLLKGRLGAGKIVAIASF